MCGRHDMVHFISQDALGHPLSLVGSNSSDGELHSTCVTINIIINIITTHFLIVLTSMTLFGVYILTISFLILFFCDVLGCAKRPYL